MKISKILAVGSFPEMDHLIEAHRESTQVAFGREVWSPCRHSPSAPHLFSQQCICCVFTVSFSECRSVPIYLGILRQHSFWIMSLLFSWAEMGYWHPYFWDIVPRSQRSSDPASDLELVRGAWGHVSVTTPCYISSGALALELHVHL